MPNMREPVRPLVPLEPCGSRRQSAAARAYSSAGAESRGLVLTARADLSEERKLPEGDERHPADVDDAATRSNSAKSSGSWHCCGQAALCDDSQCIAATVGSAAVTIAIADLSTDSLPSVPICCRHFRRRTETLREHVRGTVCRATVKGRA